MRILRYIAFGAGGVILAGGIFLLSVFLHIESVVYGKIFFEPQDIEHSKVGVVLGTSEFLASGSENRYFTHRIDAAEELYNNQKVDVLLMSGDFSGRYYNEPGAMKRALVARGIPEEDIITDGGGVRTLDSVIRAGEVYDYSEFIIISQGFHVKRAVYIGRLSGFQVQGYGAQDVPLKYGVRIHIREFFARIKAWADIYLLDTQPQSLEKNTSS